LAWLFPLPATFSGIIRLARFTWVEVAMRKTPHVNVPCEHALFLRLFVSNGGGW
jgi:hypothetical protein